MWLSKETIFGWLDRHTERGSSVICNSLKTWLRSSVKFLAGHDFALRCVVCCLRSSSIHS